MTFPLALLFKKWLNPPCLLSAEAACWSLLLFWLLRLGRSHARSRPCSHILGDHFSLGSVCKSTHPDFHVKSLGGGCSDPKFFLKTDHRDWELKVGQDIWPVLSFQWNSYNQWEGGTLTSVPPAVCMVINISCWIVIIRNWSNNSKHEL